MRSDQISVMLRDLARRALQWADVLEKEYEDTGLADGSLKAVVTLLETPSSVEERGLDSSPSSSPSSSSSFVAADKLPPIAAGASSSSWRRGDFFYCESCREDRHWWADVPPWPGAICSRCYTAWQNKTDPVG